MDKVVTIYDAKTNLSKLIKEAQAGKTIYIGAFGTAQAILAPLPTKKTVRLGIWDDQNEITYSDEDIMNTDQETLDAFNNSKIYPDDDE